MSDTAYLIVFISALGVTMAIADWLVYMGLRQQIAEISRKWSADLVAREVRDNGRLSFLEDAQARIDERQRELEARISVLVDQQQTIRLRIEKIPDEGDSGSAAAP